MTTFNAFEDVPRTDTEMREWLQEAVIAFNELPTLGMDSYRDAGLMTYNEGLVFRFENGAEFQVQIVQSGTADEEEDSDD
jgi:hypothetical protein